jgi:membrane protease YdiL (CAAX protease family)
MSSQHFDNSSRKTVKPLIDKFKGLLFPILSISLSFLFIFNTSLAPLWFGIESFPSIKEKTRFFLELTSLLGGILCLALLTEIATRYLIKHQFKFSEATFLQALSRKDILALFIVYPLTLLFEELVFRGLFYYFFFTRIPFSLLAVLNALLFGGYHMHVYFTSKNRCLTLVFISVSFLLGLFLGNIMRYFGILGCWIYHIVIVTVIYLRWNYLSTSKLLQKP